MVNYQIHRHVEALCQKSITLSSFNISTVFTFTYFSNVNLSPRSFLFYNMFKVRYLVLLLMILVSFDADGQSKDMVKVFDRTRTLMLSDTAYATEQSYRLTDDVKYDRDARGYFASLGTDGSWPDIDYHSQERSSWKPSWHMYRLMLIVRQYHKNNDAKYLEAVHRALKFWITTDPQCPNWWQNQIDIPYAYSTIILMLDKDALPIENDYLNNLLSVRAKQKAPTGQNKIWQHDIEARIALIHHDEAAFSAAMKNMQSVIKVGASEGIQPDFSFHQHGPMLQFGNYGLHFINSLLLWMTVSANTQFAFDTDKQKMIFDYCSNGIRWSVYKGAMDITAIGRQLRHNAALKRGKNLLDDFNLLRSFDNADACKYALDGLTDNCTVNGTKGFWRSDYLVQLKGGHYMMSVKTHGPGASKVESINSENMKGAFLNDGVALIKHSGKEYHDIEPLWNWTMLPGTTCDTTFNPADPVTFKTANTGVFTGLIADGTNGASVMDYDRLGIKAKKSYFMINGMLVALGAGIEAADVKSLVTTVDQNYSNGKVARSAGKSSLCPWVWHNNTGYFALNGTPFKSSVAKHSGAWSAIDIASEKEVLSADLFTIYIPHAASNTYAYAVKPEIDAKAMNKLAQHFPVTVIKNTPQVQAIQSANTLIAIFYQPGTVSVDGIKLQVDKPCMLICSKMAGKTQVWLSDPSRTQTSINLTVNNEAVPVAMPQGDYLGSTIKVQ